MIPTLATFIQFIDQLMEACDTSEVQMPKLWKGSKISNSTILARLISFCNCSQLDQDESEEESKEDDSQEFICPCQNGEEFMEQETPYAKSNRALMPK